MADRMNYTRTAISLHWLIAVLIFSGWALGWWAHDLPASPDKARYFSWHKWIGVTVFLLALARASWRMTHAAPPLPATTAPWQASASRVTHFLLYVLMLALPLSGWLMSSAKGFQTVYFGVVPLPDLLAKDEPLGKLLSEVHEQLAYALAALVALHTAAALKHHFIDRDGVLQRMLPVLAAIVVAAGLLGAAAASNVNAARSEVSATFRQMKVPVTGQFSSFRGNVTFDPKKLDVASATLEVDTASFSLGEPDYDAEARGKEWLDAGTHPQARFKSSKVVQSAPDRYDAVGTLSLKGQDQPLTVAFTLRRKDSLRSYEGQFTVSRKAFNIGDPEWNDVLEDAVVVKFKIVTPDA